MSVFLLGAKSPVGKSLKLNQEQPTEVSGGQMLNKLKSIFSMGRTYDLKLPKNPTPIETIIEVKVEHSRGKKLPKLIATDNSLINGKSKPFVIRNEGDFCIQFVGDECGWMVL